MKIIPIHHEPMRAEFKSPYSAAFAVEIARQDMDHLRQPTGQRSELLRTGTQTPVDGRAPGRGDFTGDDADHFRVDSAACRDGFGTERLGQVFDPLQAVRMLFESSG